MKTVGGHKNLGRSASGKAHKSVPRARVRAPEAEDDIGYGHPPRENRFKPGVSGNPRGRPKGRKNEATMLTELLFQKVLVRERGRERRITLYEAMLRRFAEDSLKGNIKAAAFLFGRFAAVSSDPAAASDLTDDDQAVLQAFAEEILSGKKGT
jgi:hypothetical protein